jgi:hypothetical protein
MGVMPPVLRGIARLLVPLLAWAMLSRVLFVGRIVVGCVPGAMTGIGGGAGGAGGLGILGARHMITDCVLT